MRGIIFQVARWLWNQVGKFWWAVEAKFIQHEAAKNNMEGGS